MTKPCEHCTKSFRAADHGNGKYRKYCSDRCRRDASNLRLAGLCECGAQLKDPRVMRCVDCNDGNRYWTRDNLIETFHLWNDMYGEPPSSTDWNAWQCRNLLNDEARAVRYETGGWPSHGIVYTVFGSWNAGLEAAGFEARPANGGGVNILRRRSIRQRAVA